MHSSLTWRIMLELYSKGCGRTFKTSWECRRHMNDAHAAKTFQCNRCSLVFRVRSKLLMHLRLTHEQERNYQVKMQHPVGCNLLNIMCENSLSCLIVLFFLFFFCFCIFFCFFFLFFLNLPQCPVDGCGRAFGTAYNLKVHRESVHKEAPKGELECLETVRTCLPIRSLITGVIAFGSQDCIFLCCL